MITQSFETTVGVTVNGVVMPAVVGVDIDLERPTSGVVIDDKSPVYRVTIKRYLPFGVSVDNYFDYDEFSLNVTDSWTGYFFSNCRWIKLERSLSKEGANETLVIQAKTVSVV